MGHMDHCLGVCHRVVFTHRPTGPVKRKGKAMAANFGWNYPAGFTGRELAIAGPDWEGETKVSCTCGFSGEVEAWGYSNVLHWTCPECAEDRAEEPECDGPDDPDPSDYYHLEP